MKSNAIIPAVAAASALLLVGSAAAQSTPQGLKAWGDRLQGEARVYRMLQQERNPTSLGIKAWGERLRGEARVYQQLRQQEQPGITPLGAKAWGERLQAEAREYQALRATTVSAPHSFDWSDAALGAGAALALVLVAAGGFALRRVNAREAAQT